MAPPKSRKDRRADARRVKKDVTERLRLARLEPGGSETNPVEIVSASLVEPKARAMPCAACGGSVRVEGHEAKTIGQLPLRVARVSCPMCGLGRAVYFQIRAPLPN